MMNNSITKISSKNLSVYRSRYNEGNGWQRFVSSRIYLFSQIRDIFKKIYIKSYRIRR